MNLTTKENVKALLGITDTSSDALIDDLVANVSAFIEVATNRKFDASKELVEVYDGCGVGNIVLRQYPVISVTKIEYNQGTQANPNWIVIDPVNYIVYAYQGMVYGAFPAFVQNIKITYKAGFTDIPAELTLLANQLASKEYEQRNAQGKSRESLGGATIDWVSKMTDSQQLILDNYMTLAV